MPRCFMVPGFLSSTLWTLGNNGSKIWFELSEVILGNLGKLRLAPNGLDPQPPDGRVLKARGPLPEAWATPLTLLNPQLLSAGYKLEAYAWDWRKEIYAAGQDLAGRVRSLVTPEDPCTIVGHSAGGLVCRAAWSDLVSTSQEHLVRRLITLGTPHQGSYYAPGSISGILPWEDQLRKLNLVGASINLFTRPFEGFTLFEPMDYFKLVATWPAFYELFPQLHGTDAEGDPLRIELYEASNWPAAIGVSQTWLDYSSLAFARWLRSPESLPPSWVLTTVAGVGSPTLNKLVDVKKLGQEEAFAYSADGDDVVTKTSAWIPTSAQYQITCGHNDLPLWAVQSGELLQLILDPRGPDTPTPLPVDIPGVIPPLVASPPQSTPLGGTVPSGGCAAGECRC